MQILTWNFGRSVVLVIKITPDLNANFDCPHEMLMSNFVFCMFIVSRLVSVDVI